ncbi:MAG: gamma-glutamylcyclotransferase family protein [Limnospira sp.]
MTNEDSIHVFVYGSLKPGEFNYLRYCLGRTVEECPAIALGELYSLSLGYPAMTEGDRTVWGAILSFADPNILEDLDALEGYHPSRSAEENEYQRQRIQTYTPDRKPFRQVWAYLMRPERVRHFEGVLLAEGNWTALQRRL